MSNELMPIISSIGDATIALAGLILDQSRSLRRHMAQMKSHLESQIGELRDRMGRIEGYLDVLREFFVGKGEKQVRMEQRDDPPLGGVT